MNANDFFDETLDNPFETERKPRAPQRVCQWKYTACRYNIENSNGFYTFSKSLEMSREEKEELIETVAHYNQLDSAPLRPTSDDLNDPTKFPVAFTHFKLSNGKSVICRARAVGQDYGGTRYGNFFAHAFVLSDGVWRDPIRYFASSTFDDGLTAEEANLGRTPEPLPTLDLEDIKPERKSDAFSSDLNALRALAAGFAEALRRRKNLIVGASPENLANAARYLGDFFAVLPPEIASKIEFTTYSYNPTNEELFARAKYVFLAFAPLETARDVPEEKAVVVDLDAALRGKPNVVASWANALSPQFLAFAKNFAYAGKLAASPSDPSLPQIRLETEKTDERTLDLRYLNGLTTIYAMTQGVFPQIERGWEDAWAFLSADKQTFLRERWIETWRFLNEQPFEIGSDVAQTLLRLDLSRFAQPGLKLQKNVGEIEALAERTGDLKNRFDVLLTRNILSYAVVFCAKNRLENLEATNETMRLFVAFWARTIPTERRENKEWREQLLNEIPEIFAPSSNSIVVEKSLDASLAKIAFDAFKENFTQPSADVAWIELAIGIQIAIESPSEALAIPVKRLQYLFEQYFRSGDAFQQFITIYPDFWAKKIRRKESYALIFNILNVRNDEKNLKKYAGYCISGECRSAWKRGEALKPLLNSDNDRENNYENQTHEEKNIVFVDESEHRRELSASPKNDKTLTRKKKKQRDDMNTVPDAVALVAYLVDDKEYNVLDSIFGDFNRGEFKRAKKYFETKDISLAAYKEKKRDASLPVWSQATIISVCILSIIAGIWGGLEYFRIIDWVSWF